MTNITNSKKVEKVRTDDYIYVSAMTRTRETHRICYDALMRIADAKDVYEIQKILPEYSVEPIYAENGMIDAEETVNAYLAEEFRVISKAMPQPEILNFLKVSYDCHNLKTVIKCRARGREDAGELLIDLGTVPAEKVVSAVKSQNLDIFPKNMANAFEKAEEAFSESGDPKLIDSILDEACYADMLDSVSSYNKEYFRRLVYIKIDTTNILTAIRTMRMRDTTGLFSSMFIKGGALDKSFLEKSMMLGEEGFISSLASKGYAFSTSNGEALSLTHLAKVCEDIYMKYVDNAKSISFGAEICVAYLIKASYASKMLRMAIASKQTGVSPTKIKESIGKF
ncbi:MAG: V-type ATPase subunit [Clostridia bacterium]|nr:V-type ATPase subunit [Clostridia bacterium]